MTYEQGIIAILVAVVTWLAARERYHDKEIRRMSADAVAIAAAVADLKSDVTRVVAAVAAQKTAIADLTQKVTDLSTVNDADTASIVADLQAMNADLDSSVPEAVDPNA